MLGRIQKAMEIYVVHVYIMYSIYICAIYLDGEVE